MGRIVSFHLVTERPGRTLAALAHLGADRVALARTPGLWFWRLLGTGRGDDTAAGADLRRTAMFAVWEDEAVLDVFLARSPIARRWHRAEEAYTVRLRGIGGHGTWRGIDVLDGVEPGDPGGAVAVVTRADVRPSRWRSFRAAGRPVSDEVHGAPGLLAVVGIGEAPVLRQGTFSLWRSAADVRAFARGGPAHTEVIRRTRAEGWYGEELFARFAPYASDGAWGGRDPLG